MYILCIRTLLDSERINYTLMQTIIVVLFLCFTSIHVGLLCSFIHLLLYLNNWTSWGLIIPSSWNKIVVIIYVSIFSPWWKVNWQQLKWEILFAMMAGILVLFLRKFENFQLLLLNMLLNFLSDYLNHKLMASISSGYQLTPFIRNDHVIVDDPRK